MPSTISGKAESIAGLLRLRLSLVAMGPSRFELLTSSLSGTRSNQLSYEPVASRPMPAAEQPAAKPAGPNREPYVSADKQPTPKDLTLGTFRLSPGQP